MFPKRKPLKRKVDKIVKGVIIGGAIGSVVGIGLAPKKKKKKDDGGLFKKATKQTPKKKGFFRTLGNGVKILLTGKK